MKKIVLLALVPGIVFFSLSQGFADEPKQKNLEAIEVLSGFSYGKLRRKENYELIPLSVGLDFNLKPLLKKLNFEPLQLIQSQIEPFIAGVLSPQSNIEAGTAFCLKIGVLPEGWKIQPYLKAGVGFAYMSQHTLEQGTQTNFIEYGGAGIHYFLFKNTALTFEYRLRHLSNADAKEPNAGIKTRLILGGLYHKF
jgi:hypothetical protein